MSQYHEPVLLEESVSAIITDPSGVYVDATYGGGGHSGRILEKIDAKGHLFAFDQDEDAMKNLIMDSRFTFIHQNFKHLSRYLKYYAIKNIDGILLDLGVSSWQFDEGSRGFSYRFDTELDMRMNRLQSNSAVSVLNNYSKEALKEMFSAYGEVRNATTLSEKIVQERAQRPIKTNGDFLAILKSCMRGPAPKYLAQVYQSIRIEVNDEMAVLRSVLDQIANVLKPGGRVSVITYHSIEDRIVKNFYKSGNASGHPIQDDFGNIKRPFKVITKKAVIPDEEEQKMNSRSKSAKLRIAEKL